MKDAQKPDHVSLTTLIGRLRECRYVIPDFQREFEWKPWDIRELMRSIFLDYYIGSLLLWKGKPESEPLYGFQGKRDATHMVLDGQQRLTAMYYAFLAPDLPAPSRQNRFLYFMALRGLIGKALDGDAAKLPPHVLQKIDERLQAAFKKNPALDANHYGTLVGKLEYADLRELQDTLTSRALASLFHPRFPNKETLVKRFDQLAELRNGIRHSRTVDEVTRKEGEASLLWFNQVLGT